jgi:dihydropteroate synthase
MGVVNVTPDSFSDGGRFMDPDAALGRALELIGQGADILDIGGESTRPGAVAVEVDEEVARVVPLIAAVRRQSDIRISIDTMKPAVARAAVAAGASMWNDVTALTWAEDSVRTAADLGCEVVMMHMRGDPRTMQSQPRYDDVVADLTTYLVDRAAVAMAAGVRREAIWLDPGIGFGKALDHNLDLLAHLDRFVALGFPVLLGVSRKSYIRKIDPDAEDPGDRLPGSLASALWGAQAGVAALRMHDVRETRQALAVWAAIQGRLAGA